jgi:3-oxoacyl-[acyl-carrier-protein] synthase III
VTADRYARVSGVGSALPARAVPNSYFETIVDTSDQWIAERTGIRERRFAGPGETTATLSTTAAERALRNASVAPESVDMLIVATCTPDRPLPATAAFVQARLGMTCPAFDLNAACAGFVYAASVASAQIRSGSSDRVLVIGSEVLSRVLNMQDRTTCVLFGDGAGAALFEASDDPGVIDSILAMDGSQAEVLTIPAGGSEEPTTPETANSTRHKIYMSDGQIVFRRAVAGMSDACSSLLDKAGLGPKDVDAVVAHQANARIIASVGKRLGVDPGKLYLDIEEVGNTSAASIPIALDRAWEAGRLHPGDVVLTVAFGAGFAFGANLIRWTAALPKGADDLGEADA